MITLLVILFVLFLVFVCIPILIIEALLGSPKQNYNAPKDVV